MDVIADKKRVVDLRHYMDVSNNAFLVVDAEGCVIEINKYLCALVGLKRDDILGRNWLNEFVANTDKDALKNYFQELVANKPRGVLNYSNKIRTCSGEEQLIRWSFSLDFDTNDEVIASVGFGLNETDVDYLENQLDDIQDLVWRNPSAILRIGLDGSIMTANSAAQELIVKISRSDQRSKQKWSDLIGRLIAAESANVIEFNLDRKYYQFTSAWPKDKDFVMAFGADVTEVLTSKSTFKRLAENVPGALLNYVLHEDGHETIEFLNHLGFEFWGITEQELAGDPSKLWNTVHEDDLADLRESVLSSAHSMNPWNFQWRVLIGQETKWLRGYGNPLKLDDGSIAWQTIVTDVSKEIASNIAISVARKSIVDVLVRAMEVRDPYTAGHQERVSRLAVLIAEHMGLDSHAILGLELAAKIHDIGKIKIPAEFLTKPTRLDDAEFEVIKTHAAAGALMLSDIDFDWPIADMIGQHHERWDGSGYPNGLKGNEIVLEARILAIADSVESMTNQRPYKLGLGIDFAIDEIRKRSGSLYDPDIADHALAVLSQEDLRPTWMKS